MPKYKMTAAEKTAADEKRARFKEFCQAVAALSDSERAELSARMPVITVEGHPLSHHNNALILAQIESPTIVGGFQQWRRAGRRIISGKGSALTIWIPCKRKKTAAELAADDGGADSRPGFVCGSVFDISQTAPIHGIDGLELADDGAAPLAIGYTAESSADVAESSAPLAIGYTAAADVAADRRAELAAAIG